MRSRSTLVRRTGPGSRRFESQALRCARAASQPGDDMEIHEVLGWSLLVAFSGLLLWRSSRSFEISKAYILVSAVALAGIVVQGHVGGQLVFLGGTGVAAAAAPATPDPHEAAAEHHDTQAAQNDSSRDPESSSDDQKDAQDDHSQHQHAH